MVEHLYVFKCSIAGEEHAAPALLSSRDNSISEGVKKS